jgi:hypothetical protein
MPVAQITGNEVYVWTTDEMLEQAAEMRRIVQPVFARLAENGRYWEISTTDQPGVDTPANTE